jgi:hypothetical protein
VKEGGRWVKETKAYTGSKSGADEAFYVWRSQCRTGKQTVRFFRKVELPGVPRTLRFTLFGDRSSFKKVELNLNDETVLLVPDYSNVAQSTFDLDPAARKKLRDGENEIEVVVTKKPGSASSCNGFPGVFIALDGTFQADVKVGQKSVGSLYTSGSGVAYTHRVYNLGPSKVFSATYELSLNTGFKLPNGKYEFELAGAAISGPVGAALCQVKPPDGTSGKFRAICTIEDFEPDTSLDVLASIVFTPEYRPFDYRSASWSSRITVPNDQPRDPKSDNNGHSSGVVFCDKPSSLPGCNEAN